MTNSALSSIQTKVDDNIAAKAVATPNPSLVGAADTAEIIGEILTFLDTNFVTPTDPAGVSFTTTPTYTISGNTLAESASVVDNNGVTVNVAATIAPHLTVPYAAAGKKRLDAIVVNYLATPAVYERIEGSEVLTSAIAGRPVIPANRLFAHDLDVTDGAISASETTGYTDAQAIAAPLTGFTAFPTNTDVAATDSIFTAIRKLAKKIADNVTALAGKSDTSHTHSNATTSTAGFMSAADKIKVDAIQTDSKEIYFSPEANIQEFIVYGKFLSAELAAFDGSAAANYSFKWKTDGGTYSSSISTIASLTTALSGLTTTSKTWIQVTSNYASVAAILIRYSK